MSLAPEKKSDGTQNKCALTACALKPNRAVKLSAFIGSVITLSWFFAGWRQVNEGGQFLDWALLAWGTVSTCALVGLQGFWIYVEEKDKGRLVRKVEFFDRIHSWLLHREAK